MRAMPSGEVTLLFTDVVGSTKRWERSRDAMQYALRRHDGLLREAIAASDGYVFKTVGDAFCAAFQNAESAARAAADAQGRLSAENWDAVEGLPVRMAIHTGSVEIRDDDYFGQAVNRVARLLAIAHGGQVLLSGASATLLKTALPGGMSLVSLGAHRLRDIAAAEEVYQLRFQGDRKDFPALRSSVAVPNNLPHEFTSFVGRDGVLEEVRLLLEKSRLLTLSGTGGVGKTRTALRVAAESLERFPDGVWFVGLASLGDPSLVPVAIVSTLSLGDVDGRSILETLLEHLRERRLLLVLDNCEHVIEAVASLADTLLQRCPHVHLLATSRETLRVDGETSYIVEPLELPDDEEGRLPSLEELEASPAVRLFLDRARSVSPQFRVEDSQRSALLASCRRLDGIPLAIELAAARVNMFSLPMLAERLQDRFALLTRGARNALPHHRTLRALVDWSFGLLGEPERILFRRLAVFAGTWSLEDAEFIVPSAELERREILPLLEALCEKSLVHVEAGGIQRFRFLETIREYATEKLEVAGEKSIFERAHLEHFAYRAALAEPHLRTDAQVRWLARISGEIDNYRVALDVAERDPELHEMGLALAASLSRYWVLKGAYSEGRLRLERHIAAGGSPVSLARALCGAAIVALNRRDLTELKAYARLAVDVAAGRTDGWTTAWATAVYSLSLSHAPETATESEDDHPAHARARVLAKELGDPWILAHLEVAAGFRAAARGDDLARQAYEEAGLIQSRRSGDTFLIAASALYVAYSLLSNAPRRSASLLAESASLLEPENRAGLAACFVGLGRLAADISELDWSVRMLGVAARFRQSAGVAAWRFNPSEYRERVAASLEPSQFNDLWKAGQNMSLPEAVDAAREFALTLER